MGKAWQSGVNNLGLLALSNFGFHAIGVASSCLVLGAVMMKRNIASRGVQPCGGCVALDCSVCFHTEAGHI